MADNQPHQLMLSSTLIDDFGLKPFKTSQDEDFHDLIAERYERAATIITSNLDFAEWGDAFPNKLLGASTLDRLLHGAYRLVMDGKSYRKPRPLKKSPKDKLANSSKRRNNHPRLKPKNRVSSGAFRANMGGAFRVIRDTLRDGILRRRLGAT